MDDNYAICYNEWALDRSIKNELGLLVILSGLSRKKGYCFATNKYLADLFHTDKTTISKKLKKLADKNYISINYIKKGNQFTGRQIRLSKITTGIVKIDNRGIGKNANHNNISINNKIKYISNFTARKYENLNMFYSN